MTDGSAVADVSSESALDGFYGALLDDDPVALYERAPCGYLSTFPDGTIVKVNETFLSLTGYAREQLVGLRRFVDLLTAGGRIYHETHYAPMLQMQDSVRTIALDLVRADGIRIPVLVNAMIERDDAGDPVVVRTAIFDATDRREYERELLRAKERAETSEQRATDLARTLQRTLIPPSAPTIAGLDVAAVYRPAGDGSEVGGDFYDIFQVGVDDWVIALGDVQGKGINAAVVTALARHTIRAAAITQRRPSAILTTLNEVLLRDDSDRFCTVALVRLQRKKGMWVATASRAGHPPPVLRRAGEEPRLVEAVGSLLGVLESTSLTDVRHTLASGDALLLYTDGVTEARRGNEFFGEARLRRIIASASSSAAELANAVFRAAMDYQADTPRDDIAIVAVSVP